jgi:hypothetical protein
MCRERELFGTRGTPPSQAPEASQGKLSVVYFLPAQFVPPHL